MDIAGSCVTMYEILVGQIFLKIGRFRFLSLVSSFLFFAIWCSVAMAELNFLDLTVFLLTLAIMATSVILCCKRKTVPKAAKAKPLALGGGGNSSEYHDLTFAKSGRSKQPGAPEFKKEAVDPMNQQYQTLNDMNNEDAFGIQEGGVQRAQPGVGDNWGKAPVNPADPNYQTLANINNEDAFGAVQGGGGGQKAPVHPADPNYQTLADIDNNVFDAAGGGAGGGMQHKAPVAANDPQYMTLANVKNDVFDDKPAAPRPPANIYKQVSPADPQYQTLADVKDDVFFN